MTASFGSTHNPVRPGQWFRYWMPYQFVQLGVEGRKHVYLPLNRNYKPLGITSRKMVDYADYLSQAIVFSRDPHKFQGVWHDPEGLYLYDDAPSSRHDYFERLGRLFARSAPLIRISD